MQPTLINIRSATHTYPVFVAHGVVDHIARWLAAAGVGTRRLLLSSPTVWKRHGETLMAALPRVEHLLVPDGERSKTLQTVARLYESLIRVGADRQSTIIAVGGGVIGDTVGFAAATYLRGVDLVHVPTTLLAQVDSSIGGKVGVNHALGKNLIGAFHPPAAVIADPRLLDTLPKREFRAGLYEVVKYGVIASRALFERIAIDLSRIFARETDVITEIVTASCRIKAEVVTADERETGRRRVLNFGHTAGHALEAVTHYRRLRHGEAVAYGMLVAAQLGVFRGLLDPHAHTALTDLIDRMGPLPPVADLSTSEVLAAMRRDKKVVSGRLHVVLPNGIGDTVIVDNVSEKDLRRALRAIGLRS
ncbi:MAG: 3-dehydroquinate synthase [Acidobacteriota bacterium]|nr:3-dehydroquinate synthase [Acidobacteriota bacterium]